MKLNIDEKEQIATILERWGEQESNVPNLREGICTNLTLVIGGYYCSFIANYSREWEKHSGRPEYPVPHETLHPHEAYWWIDNHWADEYGDNRRELCRYIAAKLREELSNA